MDENDVLDVEQSDEIIEDNAVIGESDSENSIQTVADDGIEVFAVSGSSYGTISDTYLDYFEGIVQKLPYDEHYVIWRSGDYSYTLAYGEDVRLDGAVFTGSCDVVQIYRSSSASGYSSYDWYVRTLEDTLNLETENLFVYSDLGMFPTVERGFSDLEATTVLFAIGFAVVFSVCHDIFDYVLQRLRS